jgi:predicted nucleotidyltransferase component of viral defense system
MLHRETVDDNTFRLLIDLCELSGLKSFALAGGTSLALQLGHRNSIDLDFFTYETPDTELIIQQLNDFNDVELLLHKKDSTLLLKINGIKVDFIKHSYPYLGPILTENNIRLYNTMDIAAMKLNAISSRGSKKDFIDIYFLLQKYTLDEIIDFYRNKYNASEIAFVVKSLIYFYDADIEVMPSMLLKAEWPDVKEYIKNQVIHRLK